MRIHVREDGERLPLVFEETGVPAHYATCLLLNARSRNVASDTMISIAQDLIHLDQALEFVSIRDLDQRLESGRYLQPSEIDQLADLCGIATTSLRSRNSPKVVSIRQTKSFSRVDGVISSVKARRLTSLARYVDLVARIAEANAPIEIRHQLSKQRREMVAHLKTLRPSNRHSRVRNAPRERDLVKVVEFILTGNPSEIWRAEHTRIRNWAMVTLLVFCGVRQGEFRLLRESDINTNLGEIVIPRRPDDPEDPRVHEPNTKTSDRIIPILNFVSDRLDCYILGPRSDAAEAKVDNPFLFIALDNRAYGRPLSKNTVARIVRQLGDHVGVPNLVPHALRSAWVQNLNDWATEADIGPAELDRLANYLGGWSYLSQMGADHPRVLRPIFDS